MSPMRLAIVLLLLLLVGCHHPENTPEYKAGYEEGEEEGEDDVCQRIENYKGSMHDALQREGICL